MALCHYQITDRGFSDAIDMVGPSIEVLRPTSTQTALDAPSGFFTVHLASLKKGLQFPLHSLLVEFLNEVDLLPCQLVPNSHQYIAGYLIRCKKGAVEIKKVVTEESLAALGFEFVQDEHCHQPDLLRDFPGGSVDCGPFVEPKGLEEGMDGDLLIGHFMVGRKRKRDATRQGKGKRSSSRGGDSPPREQIVIEVEDRDDVAPETGTMAISSPPRSLMLGGGLATLGMIELVGRRQDRQAAMDEAKKASKDKQRELQEEVARLERELEEDKGRSANLVIENASLSSEVGSVSARVTELEGEKGDLIEQMEAEKSDQARRLEEAIESFKSSPEFTAVAMEWMDKLVVEWLNIGPSAQWMVKEAEKSFNCRLFRNWSSATS
ncbi:unnamed protein product [Cuscuta campestris]|uniref:Uncharacterized protein n=1 Tax=Cuscuta campestris TaxID=132261 RepID=A0A484KU12_9ASTE|nr:unnamed protein product [Cuscuta campestris]